MKRQQRTNVLAAFRRRMDRLGRFVVAWFAVASFALSGAPCFAMGSAGIDAVEQAGVAKPHASAHEHQAHGDSGHAAGHHEAGSSPKQPPHCPHCPLAGAMPSHVPSTQHSFCSASDDLVDQTSFVPTPSLAKYVLLVATFETPPPLIYRPPPTRQQRPMDLRGSAIALNVRNCVFLI